MKRHWIIGMVFAVPVIAFLLLSNALGYESYHDPSLNDQGYCVTCHDGFKGGKSDTLHVLHVAGTDPITTNCNLCHTGSGKDNPFVMWSTGDADDGKGCTGCHGRDYGETVGADYRGFPITGKAKSSGYGLRRNHIARGITVCLNCHTDRLQADILTEDVAAPYYGRGDVSLNGAPVNPCTNEDTANDADIFGLDNDGDLLWDSADSDCAVCLDGDGDGFGDPGDALCANGPRTDCDDSQADTYPDAPEAYDGRDNNCNGSIDEIEGVHCPDPILTPGRLAWTDQPAPGQLYDVMRSDSPVFPPASPNSACLAVATPMTFTDDAAAPAPGRIFYYLVRNTMVSDFGNSSDGTPRLFTLCP